MEQLNFSGCTILVAEDEETNFEYIWSVFKATGLTMLRARTGIEAVELCKEHPEIRLIIMDGMMPVLNGYNATREIRNFRTNLPIILLTAYVSQSSIRDAVTSGCNDYLAKPIGHEELLTMLKKWLIV
ncbi:MAG: response regulator [Bacteroidota bacterium]